MKTYTYILYAFQWSNNLLIAFPAGDKHHPYGQLRLPWSFLPGFLPSWLPAGPLRPRGALRTCVPLITQSHMLYVGNFHDVFEWGALWLIAAYCMAVAQQTPSQVAALHRPVLHNPSQRMQKLMAARVPSDTMTPLPNYNSQPMECQISHHCMDLLYKNSSNKSQAHAKQNVQPSCITYHIEYCMKNYDENS